MQRRREGERGRERGKERGERERKRKREGRGIRREDREERDIFGERKEIRCQQYLLALLLLGKLELSTLLPS